MKSVALLFVGIVGIFLPHFVAQESVGHDSDNPVAAKTVSESELVTARPKPLGEGQDVVWRQYVRLGLLVVLALAALGLGNGIGLSILGGIVASVGIWGVGFRSLPSVEGGLAVAYCLPLFLTLASKAPQLLCGAAVIVGVPTLLVSHFVLMSNWTYGAGDGIVLALFFPAVIMRALTAAGVIEAPQEKTPSTSFTPLYRDSYSRTLDMQLHSSTPDPPRRSELRR